MLRRCSTRIADVRQDEVDARQRRRRRRQRRNRPRSTGAVLLTETIDREIHADLADPAERRKTSSSDARAHHGFRSTRLAGGRRRQHEHVGGRDRRGLAVGQAQHQAAGLVDRLEAPDHSRSARRTRTSSPNPAARASQSVRMVEKPSPPFHCATRPIILTDNAPNRAAGETAAPASDQIGRGIFHAGGMARSN